MQSESNRLRAVAVALETSAFAMLSDGVGSAVTRANENSGSRRLERGALTLPRNASAILPALIPSGGGRLAGADDDRHLQATQ
jgi:hypothetical protein